MKSYRKQLKECKKNGTMFTEMCPVHLHDLFMCKKYGGQCQSKKCYEERLNHDEKVKP